MLSPQKVRYLQAQMCEFLHRFLPASVPLALDPLAGPDGAGYLFWTDNERDLVLRSGLIVERGPHVTQSGLRERHFGLLLKHEPLVARFVDAFEVDGSSGQSPLARVTSTAARCTAR